MITGAHSIIYSKNTVADRDFFRDVLQLTNVDVGDGWLIFGLPPAEVAVHPGDKNDLHEFYLMCDDVKGFVAGMKKRKIVCEPVHDQGWGILTQPCPAAASWAFINHGTPGQNQWRDRNPRKAPQGSPPVRDAARLRGSGRKVVDAANYLAFHGA
jgi:hypothetical protein